MFGIGLTFVCLFTNVLSTDTTWTLVVYTTDIWLAGTNAGIYVTVYGVADTISNTVTAKRIDLMGPKNNVLEQGQRNVYPFTSIIQFPTKIEVEATKMNDFCLCDRKWHLEKIELVNTEDDMMYSIFHNNWIKKNGVIEWELDSPIPAGENDRSQSTAVTYTSFKTAQTKMDTINIMPTRQVQGETEVLQSTEIISASTNHFGSMTFSATETSPNHEDSRALPTYGTTTIIGSTMVPAITTVFSSIITDNGVVTPTIDLGFDFSIVSNFTTILSNVTIGPTAIAVPTSTAADNNTEANARGQRNSIRHLSALIPTRCVQPVTISLARKIEEYVNATRILTTETKASKRRYACSVDNRPSSKAVGVISCFVLGSVVTVVIISDLKFVIQLLK